MSSNLMVHSGGYVATIDQVLEVPVPEDTETYHAVPYGYLVETVKDAASLLGMEVERERFALAKDGGRFFGCLDIIDQQGFGDGESFGLSIGLRGSYDRSVAIFVVFGDRVFVCDNLSWSGMATSLHKRHTPGIRDRVKVGAVEKLAVSLGDWKANRVPRLRYWRGLDWSDQRERFPVRLGSVVERVSGELAAEIGLLSITSACNFTAKEAAQVQAEYINPSYDHGAPGPWRLYNAVSECGKVWDAGRHAAATAGASATLSRLVLPLEFDVSDEVPEFIDVEAV